MKRSAGGVNRILAALLLAVSAAGLQAAAPDVAGSRDPFGVPRFPRSWIVDYRLDPEVRPREFVMSQVDRIRRELRVEDELRLNASLEAVTYRLPEGVSVADVAAHYADELGSDVLFRCRARDCGRSNDWANQIFDQAILYGPDANQIYVAREWQGRLVAMYAIERGNQRVYVHLRYLVPEDGFGIEPNALLVRRLAARGWAPVEAVEPLPDGSFDESGRAVLSGLAASLERFAGEPMYLVCHLAGGASGDMLLAASRRCAETGVQLIAAGADAPDREVALQPFGAGPLLPRPALAGSRLEIVLPGVVHDQRH